MNRIETKKWLVKHFSSELDFLIGNNWFGIIKQSDETYAIKEVQVDICEFAMDEGYWLSYPESRFETVSGASYAILLNLEEK